MITMVISGSFLFVFFKNNEHAPFVINKYQERVLFPESLPVTCSSCMESWLWVTGPAPHFLLPQFILFYFILFIYFGCIGSLSCGMWDLLLRCRLFVVAHGLLSSCGTRAPERVGSVVCGTWAFSLRRTSSVVGVCGLSCPAACGILVPDQGLKPHPLHWKADSLPLDHQGSPPAASV